MASFKYQYGLCLFIILLLVLSGCAEKVSKDYNAEASLQSVCEQDASTDITCVELDSTMIDFIDVLEASSDPSEFTCLKDFEKYDPVALKLIAQNMEESCKLLISKLLSAEETVVSTEEVNPAIQLHYTCALLRYLVENGGEGMIPGADEADSHFAWFRKFLFYACNQFCKLEYDLDNPYYKNNSIQKQTVLTVLEYPLWRIVFFTEIKGELVDQEIYMDAVNEFMTVLQHGTKSELVSVSSGPDNYLDSIKSSCNRWSIVQNEDLSVDLLIPVDNDTIVLTYIPIED